MLIDIAIVPYIYSYVKELTAFSKNDLEGSNNNIAGGELGLQQCLLPA